MDEITGATLGSTSNPSGTTAKEETTANAPVSIDKILEALQPWFRASEKIHLESAKKLIDNELENVNSNIDSIKAKVAETDKVLRSSKAENLQFLALFVGLFTFVSIEFQLFKSSESGYILPLTLTFLGSLLLFIASFYFVLLEKKTLKAMLLPIGIPLTLIVLGTMFYTITKQSQEENLENQFEIYNICSKLDQKILETAKDESKGVEYKTYLDTYNRLLCEDMIEQN